MLIDHLVKHSIENMTEWRVPGITLQTLWAIIGPLQKVDILTLDLEGHDHDVILQTNFDELAPKPRYILYENIHIPSDEIRAQVLTHLGGFGYSFIANVSGCYDPAMDVLVGL